ncbi:Uncharacterized protein TCM_034735 [Theobroma cacao]|uniref:Uncharacterized protein n=1 Tax=Theobroma cacao TaxID=3641 RepID=A0A061FGE6_THECC|nr:Uncharacterized protein TCM_034735 [Theobroma cacao]
MVSHQRVACKQILRVLRIEGGFACLLTYACNRFRWLSIQSAKVPLRKGIKRGDDSIVGERDKRANPPKTLREKTHLTRNRSTVSCFAINTTRRTYWQLFLFGVLNISRNRSDTGRSSIYVSHQMTLFLDVHTQHGILYSQRFAMGKPSVSTMAL